MSAAGPVARVRDRVSALDRRLTAPGPAWRLVAVHTAVALVIGVRLAGRDWTLVAARPAVLTERLTLVGWLPAPPPVWLLVALQVVGLAGVALVLVRRAPRLGFALAWTALLLLAGAWGSSGKVMHNDVLLVTVGAVLLAARVPAARRWSRRSGTAEPGGRARPAPPAPSVALGWPPRAALAVLGTVYLLTGVQKVRHSGAEWVLSDNMAWVLRQGVSPFGPELTRLVADHAVLPHLLAGGALALELTAPVLLALRLTRLPFALAVTVLHTSIWAFLGLDYSAWVLTALAVAVPTGLPLRLPRRRGRATGAGDGALPATSVRASVPAEGSAVTP